TGAPRLEHDLLQVAPAITVMIRKAAGAGDPHAETAQVVLESFGPGDSGEGERREPLQRAGSDRFAVRLHEPARLQAAMDQRGPGIVALERGGHAARHPSGRTG